MGHMAIHKGLQAGGAPLNYRQRNSISPYSTPWPSRPYPPVLASIKCRGFQATSSGLRQANGAEQAGEQLGEQAQGLMSHLLLDLPPVLTRPATHSRRRPVEAHEKRSVRRPRLPPVSTFSTSSTICSPAMARYRESWLKLQPAERQGAKHDVQNVVSTRGQVL